MNLRADLVDQVEFQLSKIGNDRCRLINWIVNLKKEIHYLQRELGDNAIQNGRNIKRISRSNSKL